MSTSSNLCWAHESVRRLAQRPAVADDDHDDDDTLALLDLFAVLLALVVVAEPMAELRD
jgi:hypothetical protein